MALAADVSSAPPGAWRGELIMACAVLCMAFYNVLSRPFIRRSSPLGFLSMGMGAGVAVLVTIGVMSGRLTVLGSFDTQHWIAGIYIGVAGGAAAFVLWVVALRWASPTQVANTITVNPIAAAVVAALLIGEPVTLYLVLGLIAVCAGIWIATGKARAP
jgi:drug/metabolite transporter (DMT)-like permease